ncbi:SubName: Full=Related to NOP6-protein with possible role in rRNA processing {ECO:0000313/EMBL:CCA67151.1} [Serendipita indica DSM 11827]|uniref:Related to NOP6-protein with possible role in rRNA processing n=1 Tax=Serendipita indica (strain DSM 11827) TaxID=1109443 RepID=G4T762_SERID|nr:SubName: Full=Related to NOP6-protein with possible role in rRNA processing {ECO:0000313/EMBL:CCA67151.1} [Serendipita indica DSM 11827]CCA67151.1 related to NOP6-protein with possible role in rRNA processing [Serendipita indica DSM 11827]
MSTTKLTKKQRKAAAFRSRKSKGGDEPLDLPALDDPEVDLNAEQMADVLPQPTTGAKTTRSRGENKKRKREHDEDTEMESLSPKRLKTDEGEKLNTKRTRAPPKYILFVGNLSYKTSVQAIAEHFSTCDPPPNIRQLTTRRKTDGDTQPEKSKGCAFLEFTKASGLQAALRLHHSVLDGRKINVELSAGGGGKSEARLKKLKTKNAKLDKHRSESANRRKNVSGMEDETESKVSKARFSETSGDTSVPMTKRTWSVSKNGEKASRGGQRHKRGIKHKGSNIKGPRTFTFSGANAIPIG